MQPDAILGALEKINDRLGSVEQNLQHLNGQFDRLTRRVDTLPTRDEFVALTTRVDSLPTRDEIDARLVPLATRDELDAGFDTLRVEFDERMAGLLTRVEFDERVAGLPTRVEFDERMAGLPTRVEFDERMAGLPTRVELKQEHFETRRHIDVRFEEAHGRFKILAEGYEHLSEKLDKVHEDLKEDIAGVDRRVMKLEVHTGLIGGQH